MSLNDIMQSTSGKALWKNFYVRTLNVSNELDISGNLNIDGPVIINNTLDISGAVTMHNTLDVSGAVTIHSTLDSSGNITIMNSAPNLSIINNGSNTNRASITLSGDSVGAIGTSRIQQDYTGTLILENFQNNAAINLTTIGSAGNINLTTDSYLRLSGANYTTPGILSLNSSNNIVSNSSNYTVSTVNLVIGSASTGITYANQRLLYLTIGNMVFFQIYIDLTSKGSLTGAVKITGLPAAATSYYSTVPMNWASVTYTTNYTAIFGTIAPGSTEIVINQQSSINVVNAAFTEANLNDNTGIYVSSFYFKA